MVPFWLQIIKPVAVDAVAEAFTPLPVPAFT